MMNNYECISFKNYRRSGYTRRLTKILYNIILRFTEHGIYCSGVNLQWYPAKSILISIQNSNLLSVYLKHAYAHFTMPSDHIRWENQKVKTEQDTRNTLGRDHCHHRQPPKSSCWNWCLSWPLWAPHSATANWWIFVPKCPWFWHFALNPDWQIGTIFYWPWYNSLGQEGQDAWKSDKECGSHCDQTKCQTFSRLFYFLVYFKKFLNKLHNVVTC